jgi:hypothetical protein
MARSRRAAVAWGERPAQDGRRDLLSLPTHRARSATSSAACGICARPTRNSTPPRKPGSIRSSPKPAASHR